MTACPCCGSPMATHEIKVDLASNVLAVGWCDSSIELTATCAVIAQALAEAMPAGATMKAIGSAIWGAGERPPVWARAVRQNIMRLRKLIKPANLEIVNVQGRGYRMQRVGGTV